MASSIDFGRLSSSQSVYLARLIEGALKAAPLPVPSHGESEPGYTARCIQPLVAGELTKINHHGLHRSGDGAPTVRTVSIYGLDFHPDVGLSRYGQLLLAIEVKLLRTSGRQSALTSAIGQAALYRLAGYDSSIILLIDTTSALSDKEIWRSENLVDAEGAGISMIVRRRGVDGLLPHPARIG